MKILTILIVCFLIGITSAEKIDARVDNIYYPHMEDLEKICGSDNFNINDYSDSINTFRLKCLDEEHYILLGVYYDTYSVKVSEYGDIVKVKDWTEYESNTLLLLQLIVGLIILIWGAVFFIMLKPIGYPNIGDVGLIK